MHENIKIGLEIHVPLKTNEKLFCSCPTNYYEVDTPNTNVCEVCSGMPGSKPHPINARAFESAVMIAKLLDCRISGEKKYIKRKHYDYPDLPSGYQRTSEPIGVGGKLGNVGIWEVHIEEDPGRYDSETETIDYNRSGVPLIEIVTAPEMYSPDDVTDLLKSLINILRYTERIVDVGGVIRADCNISIRGGAKVEIKNINSIKGAYKALKYEIIRQKNIMERGGVVTQETRAFDQKSMITTKMRVKETAEDYRYIPDPDIPPVRIEKDFADNLPLPETPQLRKKRVMKDLGLEENYADVIVRDKQIADMFEVVAKETNPADAARWITQEVLKQLNYRGLELSESKLNATLVSDVIRNVRGGIITETVGKKLIERIIDSGEIPSEIIEKENLGTVKDKGLLEEAIIQIIGENPKAVQDYKAGNKPALNFLIGKVMQKMKGKSDIREVTEEIRKRI